MFSIRRATVFSALAAAALIGLSSVIVTPANAVTRSLPKSPFFAIKCSGDVCIQTASKNLTYANVNAWANTTTFTGHFQLLNTGCGITWGNSPTGTWPAGGTHYTFVNVLYDPVCGGDHWQVIAWKKTANGNKNIGAVAFQI